MKEEEIRPQSIFDEYLKLAKIDTKVFFDKVERKTIACPACLKVGKFAFNKHGFCYQLCLECDTLFVSPRPLKKAFTRYYTDAPSTKYWATKFYKETAEARRKKLWRPKAILVNDMIKSFGSGDEIVIDIGGGYGLFAEEIRTMFDKEVTVIEPGLHLAKRCRDRGIDVVENFLEDVEKDELPDGKKVFVSFELFEHLHNPELFLIQLYKLMLPGDLFIFTTLSGTGIDIQGLWEDSKSVSPPHHLNFFNPYSIKILLKRSGFKVLSVTTPGRLDIDILSSNADLIKDRFLKTLIKRASDKEKSEWQQIVAKTGQSSHMMVCCQK